MRFGALVVGGALLLVPSLASATYGPPPPACAGTCPTLAHSPEAPAFRQKVQVVATQVTGPVIFKDGDKVIGQVDAVGTTATFEIASLSPGAHSITATAGVYTIGAAQVFTIAKASTKVELVQTLDLTPEKESATFLAKVTSDPGPVADGGGVIFQENGQTLGASVELKDGLAKLDLTDLPLGRHTITALYLGTNEFTDSGSTAVTHTVTVKSATSSTPTTGNGGGGTTTTPGKAEPPAASAAAEDDDSCSATGHASTSSAWLIGLALLVVTRGARFSRASRARSSRREG